MLIGELMTRNVEWTTPDTTLAEAARRMRDRNIGCLPVGEAAGFIGMLTEKDIVSRASAEGMNPTATSVRQIMTKGVIYCRENDSIETALQFMSDNRVHHLPVLDVSGKVVGIASLSDLALRGPEELYPDISKLAFQSTTLARTSGAILLN